MPRGVSYSRAPEVCEALRIIVEELGFKHIDVARLYCVRSRGSRSRAYARIYGTPGAWKAALGYNPGYVIEVLSENFERLSLELKVKTLIHELLHIPSTFSGGLRPHGRLVNGRVVHDLYRRLARREEVIDRLSRLLGP